MKSILVTLMVLCFSGQSWGQVFKEKEYVFIGESANSLYPVIYTKLHANDTIDKTFGPNGKLISYKLVSKINWDKADTLSQKKADSFKFPQRIKASVIPEKNRLLVYFWDFPSLSEEANKKNNFINDNFFSIKLEENINFSITNSSWHLGAMTIPLKVYLDRRNKDFTGGMVETGINTGIYLGYKRGYKKYVKLKHEKEFRIYTKALSLNSIIGISKLSIDEKNSNTSDIIFTGAVPALNIGIALGLHYRDFALFGAFGYDIPFKYGADWNYKGKPWLGMGVGYKLF